MATVPHTKQNSLFHLKVWEGVGGCRPPLIQPASSASWKRPPSTANRSSPSPASQKPKETTLSNSQQNLPQPSQPIQLHSHPTERLLPHQISLPFPCPSQPSNLAIERPSKRYSDVYPNSLPGGLRKGVCKQKPADLYLNSLTHWRPGSE